MLFFRRATRGVTAVPLSGKNPVLRTVSNYKSFASTPFSYEIFLSGCRYLFNRISDDLTHVLACGAVRRRKKKSDWGATSVAINVNDKLRKGGGYGLTTHYSLPTIHYCFHPPACMVMERNLLYNMNS